MSTPVLAAIIAALALSIPAVGLVAYEYGRSQGPERIVITSGFTEPARIER